MVQLYLFTLELSRRGQAASAQDSVHFGHSSFLLDGFWHTPFQDDGINCHRSSCPGFVSRLKGKKLWADLLKLAAYPWDFRQLVYRFKLNARIELVAFGDHTAALAHG